MSSDSASTQNSFSSTSGVPQPPASSKVITLVTATNFTVTPLHSGYILQLPSVGATISLPAASVAKGCTFTFILIANQATTAYGIASTTSNVWGRGVQGATASTPYPLATGATSLVLGTGCLKGDQAVFTCDGTNYYVTAFSGYNTASTNGLAFS